MHITQQFLGFALLGAEWVMWLLVGLSVISIAIMVERTVCFLGARTEMTGLVRDVAGFLRVGDLRGARKRVEKTQGLAAAVGRAALAEADRGIAAVEEAAASTSTAERMKLERGLAFLGTVGNNAPFIGLFGTVVGIIRSFHDLALDTQGGATTVMAGISEALVATAIGLLVAIPAVAAFNVFQRRLKALAGDATVLTHVILAGLKGELPQGAR
jgi:biopolymer transport protein ExbB/TolQ